MRRKKGLFFVFCVGIYLFCIVRWCWFFFNIILSRVESRKRKKRNNNLIKLIHAMNEKIGLTMDTLIIANGCYAHYNESLLELVDKLKWISNYARNYTHWSHQAKYTGNNLWGDSLSCVCVYAYILLNSKIGVRIATYVILPLMISTEATTSTTTIRAKISNTTDLIYWQ